MDREDLNTTFSFLHAEFQAECVRLSATFSQLGASLAAWFASLTAQFFSKSSAASLTFFSFLLAVLFQLLYNLLIGFFIYVCFLVAWRRFGSPLSDIPGPLVASFSESLWQLYHIIHGHIEEAVIRLHDEHGKFVRIGSNEVSICDPAAIRQVLMSHMDKGPTYAIFSMPDKRYVNLMAERSYEEHTRKSRNLAPGFSFSNIIKIEPHIDSALQILRRQLTDLGDRKEPVDFSQWLNFLSFDILGEATFSKTFGFLESGKDIGNTVKNNVFLRQYIAILGHFPWAHDFLLANPMIGFFNLTPAMHVFDTCVAAIKVRSANSEVRVDMLEQWKIQLKAHPKRMEEIEILTNAVGNLGAGSDTVSSVLQAFLYYVMKDRNILHALRTEIDEADLSDIPTYEETQRLPILQACIKETYRFHTPVGFGLTRVSPSPEGVTVAGRYFPPGTILSVNPWVIHRIKSLFGEDAREFNPRRWLGDLWRAKEMDRVMIPFGAGYNGCPGRHLGHLEVSKAAAMMIREFHIRLVDEKKEWKYENYFTVSPHSWPCYVKRRSRRR
ncbi:cytochrome P450 [Xylogone sp. PMI_703]|nr:cytochrome P450 [Xylogone sp. PMI_703]